MTLCRIELTCLERIFRIVDFHVNIIQEQVAEVDAEPLHENVTIDFADVNLEHLCLGISSWGDVVNEILVRDFRKSLPSYFRLREVVRAHDANKTPLEVFIVETQDHISIVEAVLRSGFQVIGELPRPTKQNIQTNV